MNSKRKCAHCGKRGKAETMFIHGIQAFCNKDHYIEYAASNVKSLADKGRKAIKKDAGSKLRAFRDTDKALRMRAAVSACNAYIRLRDSDQPCISCGTTRPIQYHAGHYRPAGKNSALRFDERNIHKQCSICNNHLSGNLVNYRVGLIEKLGLEVVEELDNNSEIKRYTPEELKQIELHYKAKIKQLEAKAA